MNAPSPEALAQTARKLFESEALVYDGLLVDPEVGFVWEDLAESGVPSQQEYIDLVKEVYTWVDNPDSPEGLEQAARKLFEGEALEYDGLLVDPEIGFAWGDLTESGVPSQQEYIDLVRNIHAWASNPDQIEHEDTLTVEAPHKRLARLAPPADAKIFFGDDIHYDSAFASLSWDDGESGITYEAYCGPGTNEAEWLISDQEKAGEVVRHEEALSTEQVLQELLPFVSDEHSETEIRATIERFAASPREKRQG